MPATIKPGFSFWYDLYFHLFSYLPIAAGDASSLYNLPYQKWLDSLFAGRQARQRTIRADAALLARLYNTCPQAHQLSLLLCLFESWPEFLDQLEKPFAEISWATPGQKQAADRLQEQVPENLTELLRIALWKEAAAGYAEIHKEVIEPLYAAHTASLAEAQNRLAAVVRGMAEAEFITSYPLLYCGRGLAAGGQPRIFTGLPLPEPAVPLWAPLMQGCHEYILSRVLEQLPAAPARTTRRGTPGFAQHLGPEIVALSLAANLFRDQHSLWFTRWLAWWFPGGAGRLAGELPWPVTHLPGGTDSLAGWLAAAHAIPASLHKDYRLLLDWFGIHTQ